MSLFQRIRSRSAREHWRSVVRRFVRVLDAAEWFHERSFERRLGVLTIGLDPDAGARGQGEEHHAHTPSYYRGTRKVLRALTAAETSGVFVDYGSGAGRVLIMAATTCPFKRVVGVELSPHLNEIARKNIERVRAMMACQPIDLVTMDAAGFTVPDDASVLFFADPFHGDALASAFRHVRESLRRAPRHLVLICYNHQSLARLTAQVDRCDWLRMTRQVRLTGHLIARLYANVVDEGSA